ncbi:MAG: hypothetical protein KBF17_05135 [Candidatus Promineofilum sp.]|nr:hypothetical protein [Promineifilum sp.]MBP9657752.1 hypothetical protein [Promineifilum sp.]
MMKIEELVIEIESLPEKEYERLRLWFMEREWKNWDAQLEADEAAGKLAFLVEEAFAAKEDNRLLPF